jgi:hypothetical protein
VRDGLAVFAEPGEVELDGLPHLVQDSFFGVCERDAARQVRAPCAVSAVVGTLDDDCVTGYGVLRFSPACLRMLRSVPGGKTALSFPATVTRPGLAGCLYCRWLPRVAAKYQLSASVSLIISLTLSGTGHLSPMV